ncbi:Ppx/GppA family phosphatase [Parerythrobacter jejuensis]|uniref:Ppx/GppA family phosphatase n=1 Tax=Parerythrobacter jejuensis TaxID=795812 RepID=A0A845ARV9_9SPHN|nr:Ppx/GppA family phosphatase [Parerythrobacter jejuensis]MXP31923.1 Ppx/GppA family phosphatase [Parerythrobacter jejuensis]
MALNGRRADREGLFSGNTPRHAIIDIGSNTVRLVVYGGSPRAPTVLLNEKVAARLGRDITATGKLADEAVELAMRGLERYALLLRDLEIDQIDVVATAAVREASNGKPFIKALRDLGFAPRVLSGEEEAAASAWGVLGAFPDSGGLVADLGGGSLELVRLDDRKPGKAVSLPIGTLRLPELGGGDQDALRKAITGKMKDAKVAKPVDGDLYLVGGTWRAMAVYAMEQRDYPLTDPHGLSLPADEAMEFARHVAGSASEDLRTSPRISTMRSASMPDAAVLLQVLIKKLKPERVVVSSWGLREGILFDALEPHAQAQDPLIAGVSAFSASRGAAPTMATRIASWTVDAVPASGRKSERLRLAATMLSLSAMQIEPNLRMRVGIEWALHKRWIAIDPEGRAMIAAAICANGNNCTLPDELYQLADKKALDQAIGWGLAIRLCRRIGARSRQSLRKSHLAVEGGKLLLSLEQSHAALFGIPNEKDLNLLAAWMNLQPEVVIVENGAKFTSQGGDNAPQNAGN